MSEKAIPAGHHTVTPYLAIKNAPDALEFYKPAFGATETYKNIVAVRRLCEARGNPDTGILAAELRGDSMCPCRVRTALGRTNAERDVAEGADRAVVGRARRAAGFARQIFARPESHAS